MDNVEILSIDAWPRRRKPKQGESLTSLLIDLAKRNDITSVKELTGLIYRTGSSRDLSKLEAGWQLRAGKVCLLTALRSKKALTDLTLLPYLKIFFMPREHIADYRRFCPSCLEEDAFYRLIWRLNIIRSCPKHQLLLLDCCTHCATPIAFLQPPFEMTNCPNCGKDLRLCGSTIVDNRTADTDRDRIAVFDSVYASEADPAQIRQALMDFLFISGCAKSSNAPSIRVWDSQFYSILQYQTSDWMLAQTEFELYAHGCGELLSNTFQNSTAALAGHEVVVVAQDKSSWVGFVQFGLLELMAQYRVPTNENINEVFSRLEGRFQYYPQSERLFQQTLENQLLSLHVLAERVFAVTSRRRLSTQSDYYTLMKALGYSALHDVFRSSRNFPSHYLLNGIWRTLKAFLDPCKGNLLSVLEKVNKFEDEGHRPTIELLDELDHEFMDMMISDVVDYLDYPPKERLWHGYVSRSNLSIIWYWLNWLRPLTGRRAFEEKDIL